MDYKYDLILIMDAYQAKIILKALKDGWTVSMNDKEELIFNKNTQNMTMKEQSEVYNNGFSAKFLKSLIGENTS